MTERFEFELIFKLPAGDHDPFDLSDAVYGAGFEDAVIGTGNPKVLAVALEAPGDDAEAVIISAARAIIANLPGSTELREVRPDLVSLADVAEKLEVSRQTLQQREMPPPVSGGLYRIDEIAEALEKADEAGAGKRRPRFRAALAKNWFLGGEGARKLNARLALKTLNAQSLQMEDGDDGAKLQA